MGRKHEFRVSCAVGLCQRMFRDPKEMHRHVRLEHRSYAADPTNNIRTDGGACPHEGCKKKFTRNDNIKRHRRRQHGYEDESG